MEGSISPALSDALPYDSWEEVNIPVEKGRKEVHYYLKRNDGASDLVIVGKEKTLKRMTYRLAIPNRALFTTLPDFAKLKGRSDVVDWLNSVVSDSTSKQTHELGVFRNGRVLNLDNFKELQSTKLGKCTREFSWIGSSWIGRRRRKHYQSFRRNGFEISVHDFVYVLAEKDKRLVAYLEDMYEDSRGNKMVVVRWFHEIDEVGIVLPHSYNDREIFFSLCLQDLSVECIDGLATVLSPQHFKKFMSLEIHSLLEPFVCEKLFENDYVKPFDITKVKGYEGQDVIRYLSSASPLNDNKTGQRPSGDQTADMTSNYDARLRLRKRHLLSNDDELCFKSKKLDVKVADEQGTDLCRLGSSSSSLCPGEAKQNSFQNLIVGSEVEVLSQDSGIRGCWFRALIVKKHKNKVKIQYQDVQDAGDESNKLEEWLLASRAADPDQLGIRLRGRTTIRPLQPSNRGRISSIIDVGTVVDVWWHDGWWEGIVFKKDSEDKLHVYFPGENQEAVFGPTEVRHSQEWLGNEWIVMKERPDLVSLILARLDKRQALDQPGVSSSDQTAVSDSQQTMKDDPGSNSGSGNKGATNTVPVLDLSKDDFLSQLKWSSCRKRRRVTAFPVEKLDLNDNHCKSTRKATKPVAGVTHLIPKRLKVDPENCKSAGDVPFYSSVVPPLSGLVVSR